MPSAAQAMASDFVNCSTPAFEDPYAGFRGLPKRAYIDAMFTIAPFAALSAGCIASAQRKRAGQVHVEHVGEEFRRHFLAPAGDRGAVHEDVDAGQGGGVGAHGPGIGHVERV
jgi:hypothetical protein